MVFCGFRRFVLFLDHFFPDFLTPHCVARVEPGATSVLSCFPPAFLKDVNWHPLFDTIFCSSKRVVDLGDKLL